MLAMFVTVRPLSGEVAEVTVHVLKPVAWRPAEGPLVEAKPESISQPAKPATWPAVATSVPGEPATYAARRPSFVSVCASRSSGGVLLLKPGTLLSGFAM